VRDKNERKEEKERREKEGYVSEVPLRADELEGLLEVLLSVRLRTCKPFRLLERCKVRMETEKKAKKREEGQKEVVRDEGQWC